MLLWIIAAYLFTGMLITAWTSKGTFWINDMTDKKVSTWIGTVLALITLFVTIPFMWVYAYARACITKIREYKGVEL